VEAANPPTTAPWSPSNRQAVTPACPSPSTGASSRRSSSASSRVNTIQSGGRPAGGRRLPPSNEVRHITYTLPRPCALADLWDVRSFPFQTHNERRSPAYSPRPLIVQPNVCRPTTLPPLRFLPLLHPLFFFCPLGFSRPLCLILLCPGPAGLHARCNAPVCRCAQASYLPRHAACAGHESSIRKGARNRSRRKEVNASLPGVTFWPRVWSPSSRDPPPSLQRRARGVSPSASRHATSDTGQLAGGLSYPGPSMLTSRGSATRLTTVRHSMSALIQAASRGGRKVGGHERSFRSVKL
jgi:hypothetical protein